MKRTLGLLYVVAMIAAAPCLLFATGSSEVEPVGDGSTYETTDPVKLVYPNWDEDEITAAGVDLEDNPWTRALYEMTGVRLLVEFVPSNGYADKIKLMVAAREDFDLFRGGAPDDWIRAGAIGGSGELFEQFAPDMIAQATKASLDVVTVNGEILGAPVPEFRESKHMNLIRADWLETLGLPVPRTVDEYTAFFRAVRATDLDGNGLNDEYGLSLKSGFQWLHHFAGGWGFAGWYDEGTFVDFENRRIVFWAMTDDARGYFSTMASWWQEGLIDPDSLSQDSSAQESKVYSGKVGIIRGYLQDIPRKEKSTMAVVGHPVTFAALPPIQGPKPAGYYNSAGVDRVFFVYRGSRNKEQAVRLLNFFWTPDGRDVIRNGIVEGIDYSLDDGVRVPTTPEISEGSLMRVIGGFGPTDADTALGGFLAGVRREFESYIDDPALVDARMAQVEQWQDEANERWITRYYTGWRSQIDAGSIPAFSQNPDYLGPFREYRLKFLTGLLDAGDDEDWQEYLDAMDDAGVNDVLEASAAAFFEQVYDRDPAAFADYARYPW